MLEESKNKTFYAAEATKTDLKKAKKSLPNEADRFYILLHNQTIMNDKLNKFFTEFDKNSVKLNDLLKSQGQGRD